MICKTCGEVHQATWSCFCGKHAGLARLSGVRRDYDDEHHGVWYCEKDGKPLERDLRGMNSSEQT